MHLFINVINKKYISSKFWKEINVAFQQQGSEWRPGKKIFKIEKYGDDDYFLFIFYVAMLYREFLQHVVKKRKWEKFWIPLNKKYLKYKKEYGRYENIWMNTGVLIDSISIVWDKKKNRIRIGIDEKVKYNIKGVKKQMSVLTIAKFMEYGTENMPARPLFRRAREYISKNIGRFYKDYLHFTDLIEE